MNRQALTICILMICFLNLTGCSGSEPSKPAPTNTEPMPSSKGQLGTDLEIRLAVNKRFSMDEELSNANIRVEAEGGIVTLKGIVYREAVRRRAEEIATNTAGVKGVINAIRVERLMPSATPAPSATKTPIDIRKPGGPRKNPEPKRD